MNKRKSRDAIARTYMDGRNAEVGRQFVEISRAEFPPGSTAIASWRNSQFIVTLYNDKGFARLSVNRSTVRQKGFDPNGQPVWDDGITWDELNAIKSAVGFADRWMVEVYPPAAHLVNVANMRHLWLLEEEPEFGWRNRL